MRNKLLAVLLLSTSLSACAIQEPVTGTTAGQDPFLHYGAAEKAVLRSVRWRLKEAFKQFKNKFEHQYEPIEIQLRFVALRLNDEKVETNLRAMRKLGWDAAFIQSFQAALSWAQDVRAAGPEEAYRKAIEYEAKGNEAFDREQEELGELYQLLAEKLEHKPAIYEKAVADLASTRKWQRRSAISRLERLAGKDHLAAQVDLFRAFRDGKGEKVDLACAYYWGRRAIDNGATIDTEVEHVGKGLTTEQWGEVVKHFASDAARRQSHKIGPFSHFSPEQKARNDKISHSIRAAYVDYERRGSMYRQRVELRLKLISFHILGDKRSEILTSMADLGWNPEFIDTLKGVFGWHTQLASGSGKAAYEEAKLFGPLDEEEKEDRLIQDLGQSLWELARDLGDDSANFDYGTMTLNTKRRYGHYSGFLVLERLAKKNHVSSQIELFRQFRDGKVMKANLVGAYFWGKQAIENGADIHTEVADVRSKLSETDLKAIPLWEQRNRTPQFERRSSYDD